MLLEIRNDPKITVAQFLATFKGLTSSVKRSEVASGAGLSYQPLATLLDGSGTALDLARTNILLSAMQLASRPPKHAVLGAVGKDAFERWAANHLGGLASQQPGGLEDEPIGDNTLKHVGDERLRECGATEDEIDILRTRRVELNALTTKQLVTMVEAALAEHGITKVIPETEQLQAAWRAANAHAEIAAAIEEANKWAALWQDAAAPDDLAEQVRDLLEQHPEMSWDAALRAIVEGAAP